MKSIMKIIAGVVVFAVCSTVSAADLTVRQIQSICNDYGTLSGKILYARQAGVSKVEMLNTASNSAENKEVEKVLYRIVNDAYAINANTNAETYNKDKTMECLLAFKKEGKF